MKPSEDERSISCNSHAADVRSPNGQTVPSLRKALLSRRFDISEILIKGGADVNSGDSDSSILLHGASGNGV